MIIYASAYIFAAKGFTFAAIPIRLDHNDPTFELFSFSGAPYVQIESGKINVQKPEFPEQVTSDHKVLGRNQIQKQGETETIDQLHKEILHLVNKEKWLRQLAAAQEAQKPNSRKARIQQTLNLLQTLLLEEPESNQRSADENAGSPTKLQKQVSELIVDKIQDTLPQHGVSDHRAVINRDQLTERQNNHPHNVLAVNTKYVSAQSQENAEEKLKIRGTLQSEIGLTQDDNKDSVGQGLARRGQWESELKHIEIPPKITQNESEEKVSEVNEGSTARFIVPLIEQHKDGHQENLGGESDWIHYSRKGLSERGNAAVSSNDQNLSALSGDSKIRGVVEGRKNSAKSHGEIGQNKILKQKSTLQGSPVPEVSNEHDLTKQQRDPVKSHKKGLTGRKAFVESWPGQVQHVVKENPQNDLVLSEETAKPSPHGMQFNSKVQPSSSKNSQNREENTQPLELPNRTEGIKLDQLLQILQRRIEKLENLLSKNN